MNNVQKPLKVIVLGNKNVGKSSLLNRYVNKHFPRKLATTITSDLFIKEIFFNNRKVKLQIWDTAGCERFQTLGPVFYRGTDCCVLVYDVTSPSSFNQLDSWRDEFLLLAYPSNPERFPFILVGNKVDMDNRKVTTRQAMEWCKKNNDMPYFETSAKDGCNIENVFLLIVGSVLEYKKAKQEPDDDIIDSFVVLDKPNIPPKQKTKLCSCGKHF